MGFLRRLFRRKPPPKMTSEEVSAALRRREEELPCCGGARYAHAQFRSGELLCPVKMMKLDLRYFPLEVDECFFPPGSEKHFNCTTCGCSRGVHRTEGHRRLGSQCIDPDCPGCQTGCT